MSLRAIVQFDHGINTPRRNGATIPERFEAYASARTPDGNVVVVTDQYQAGPFPRWNMLFGANQAIAEARADVLTHWSLTHPNVPIALVGHSNGCDIARRTAIALSERSIRVDVLVFVAAPLERTIEENGLIEVIAQGAKLSNWVMELDEVLAADDAPIRKALRWPYGNAGKCGLDDADGWVRRFEDPLPEWKVYNRRFPWKHSQAFSGTFENASFEAIYREICV